MTKQNIYLSGQRTSPVKTKQASMGLQLARVKTNSDKEMKKKLMQ